MNPKYDDHKTDIFVKAYRSFLSAGGEMKLSQVEKLYKEMEPSLHKYANLNALDIEAYIYSFLRLPSIMDQVDNIILAQTDDIFHREGYKIEFWEEVSAPARRRKMYFDGAGTLAIFINSVTDLDDVVCLLTAFQIEWNKMNTALSSGERDKDTQKNLKISDANWMRINRIWNGGVEGWIQAIKSKKLSFSLKLLRGSYVDYKKAAQRWFENIILNTRITDLRTRPVYFVSSNTHSIVNTITGWVTKYEKELIKDLKVNGEARHLNHWKKIEKGDFPGDRENFLWYLLKKYEKDHGDIKKARRTYEESMGIDFIEAKHYLDIDVQIISVSALEKSSLSKKIGPNLSSLKNSNAIIINIDYPLGAGAYMALSTLLQNINIVRGAYILGKASFLHGTLGDVALPQIVYDTFSNNTYTFKNAFTPEYLKGFLAGNILTNQKVVSSKGTLLHPLSVIQRFFLDDFAIIEMESGPYLNAIFEMSYYGRYPQGRDVSLLSMPFDIGIIHYASDTPFTKAVTLGTRNLGYDGVEATYVSSLAILRRIVDVESKNI